MNDDKRTLLTQILFNCLTKWLNKTTIFVIRTAYPRYDAEIQRHSTTKKVLTSGVDYPEDMKIKSSKNGWLENLKGASNN